MAFSPEEVTQELDRYFSENVVNGSSLGDVLVELVQNECHGALRFQGNGIRVMWKQSFIQQPQCIIHMHTLKKIKHI